MELGTNYGNMTRRGFVKTFPDSKVHRANMGPIWGRQDPGGPHVGPMNLAVWDDASQLKR